MISISNQKGWDSSQQITTIKERDFPFNEEVLSLEGDWNLVGFFQTEKYFSHVSDRIRKDFTFHEWIREDCDPIVDQFDNPVALHIRRGDYIRNSDNHHNYL